MEQDRLATERTGKWAAFACFAVPFAAYALTAARTVQGGDSGEFGVIAFNGGVAHPPGYPLYSLLIRAFARIPFGPPFWRIALCSAVCGALACVVLFQIGLRLTGRVGPAALGALTFGLSPLAWRWAGVPEVFPLHELLCALIVLGALRLDTSRDALLLGLACGLGFSNHQTIVLLGPIVFWALLRAGFVRTLFPFLGGCLLGVLPYAYLPIEAHFATSRSFVWGRVDMWPGFVVHVLRREYGTFTLYSGPDARFEPLHHIGTWLRQLPTQNVWVFLPIGIAGLAILFRKRPGFALALSTALVLAGIVFPAFMNTGPGSIHAETATRFFLMPNLLFAMTLAPGLALVQDWLDQRNAGRLAPVAFVILLAGAVSAFHGVDWARDDSLERLAIAEVQSAQPNATILGETDGSTGSMFWVTKVLGLRPDVRYIDVKMASYQWFADANGMRATAAPPPPDATIPGARLDTIGRGLAVFFSLSSPTYVIPTLAPEVAGAVPLVQEGFLYRVVRAGTPSPPLSQIEAGLQTATDTLGPFVDPIDGYSWTARSEARSTWLRLAKEYDRAGNGPQRDAALLQAIHILPEESTPP